MHHLAEIRELEKEVDLMQLGNTTRMMAGAPFAEMSRVFFVVAPIILGAVATWSLLTKQSGYEWITGTCALLAGLAPAVYKALDFDVSLDVIAKHAHQFKILQGRFRQAWRVTALAPGDAFEREFSGLMERLDAARSSSLTAPERFFRKAQAKIRSGHYDFTVDLKSKAM